MRYEVVLHLDIEDDADFLEVDRSTNTQVVKEVIEGYIYDLDDISLVYIDVEAI